MRFFQTPDGSPHGLRIAGVLLVAGLLPGCGLVDTMDAMCATRLAFASGWWLVFGRKQPPGPGLESVANPRGLLGLLLVFGGLAGQFYLIARHRR